MSILSSLRIANSERAAQYDNDKNCFVPANDEQHRNVIGRRYDEAISKLVISRQHLFCQ